MFGRNSIKRGPEDGENQGGGGQPLPVADAFPDTMHALTGDRKFNLTDPALKQLETSGTQESDEVIKPNPLPTASQGVPGARIRSMPLPEEAKGKKPDVLAQLMGELSPTLTPEEQLLSGMLQEQRKNFDKAQILSELKAGRALAGTLAEVHDLYENDYQVAKQVNEQYLSRGVDHLRRHEAAVDAIRNLSFDDQRFYRTLGPAGRMSAALSVGLAQLSAGAGNVNSVTARIDAAINRDILAQKAEMQFKVDQLDAEKSLSAADRQLMEDFYTFEEHKRTLFNHAAAAQAGRIKQTMTNEMLFQAAQMVENHYLSAAMAADAQARAKTATLHWDSQITSLAQLNKRLRQQNEAYKMASEMWASSTPALGEVAANYDTGIQVGPGGPTIGGGPIGPDFPSEPAPGQQAQAPQPAGPRVTQRAQKSAKVRQPIGQTAQPIGQMAESTGQETGQPQPSLEQGTAVPFAGATGVEPMAAPEPAQDEPQAVPVTRGGLPKPQTREELTQAIRAYGVKDEVMRAGGPLKYRYAVSAKKNNVEYPGLDNLDNFDEQVIKFLDPNNPDVRVFTSEEEAEIGLKFDTRPWDRKVRYQHEHPETLVVPMGPYETPDGQLEQNYVSIDGLGKVYLEEDSPFRIINRDVKASASSGKFTDPRMHMKEQIRDTYKFVSDVADMAEYVKKGGMTNFFDVVTIDENNKVKSTMFAEDLVGMLGEHPADVIRGTKAGELRLSYGIINQLDQGRKTDYDMMLGQQMITARLKGQSVQAVVEGFKNKFFEALGGDEQKNYIIQSQRMFMQGLAYQALGDLAKKLTSYGAVLDADAALRIEDAQQKILKSVLVGKKQKEKND